jgi:unsaturated rhamnogalacturonyl hydrolase
MLEWGDWILHSMPRTPEDGLQHRHAELENKGELWDDTLMMTVLFLAKAGVIFDLPSYRDEAVYQVLLHLFYLVDVQSGLFYHAWSFERMDNFAKALWGRGNGWLTIFIPDFLEVLDVEPAVRKFIVTRFVRQLESLAEHQDESGLWHTLIDDPDSYLEASGSAGFCYGFYKAIEAGYLDKQYLDVANKALKAIVERIDEAGCLRDVSYGTNVGTTLDHYRKIPLRSMQYGQGMALLALAAKTNG